MRRITFPLSLLLAVVLNVVLHWVGTGPAHADDPLTIAQQKAEAGDIRGALEVYAQLAELQPGSSEVFARLGGMQLLDQRYAAAVQSFQRAISLGGVSTRSFIGLGMAYLHMGQLGPARAAFVEARSRGPANPGEIDKVIAWIDGRNSTPPPGH